LDAPIAMSIVAVVRPFKSNHFSEYIGPNTWNTGCANPAKDYSKRNSGRVQTSGETANLAKNEEGIRGLWG